MFVFAIICVLIGIVLFSWNVVTVERDNLRKENEALSKIVQSQRKESLSNNPTRKNIKREPKNYSSVPNTYAEKKEDTPVVTEEFINKMQKFVNSNGKNIIIVDIETTGFFENGGKIVEIGIVMLSLVDGSRRIIYDSVVKEEGFGISHTQGKFGWIFKNTNLKYSDVLSAPTLESQRDKIQDIFLKYPATAYNKAFDFTFLRDRGFKIYELPCPMLLSTPIVNLPPNPGYSEPKWPKVEEAWEFFFGKNTGYVEKHRGADDALHEAEIVYELYKKGIFSVELAFHKLKFSQNYKLLMRNRFDSIDCVKLLAEYRNFLKMKEQQNTKGYKELKESKVFQDFNKLNFYSTLLNFNTIKNLVELNDIYPVIEFQKLLSLNGFNELITSSEFKKFSYNKEYRELNKINSLNKEIKQDLKYGIPMEIFKSIPKPKKFSSPLINVLNTIYVVSYDLNNEVEYGDLTVPSVHVELDGRDARIPFPSLFSLMINTLNCCYNQENDELACVDPSGLSFYNLLIENTKKNRGVMLPPKIEVVRKIKWGTPIEEAIKQKRLYEESELIPDGQTFEEAFQNCTFVPYIFRSAIGVLRYSYTHLIYNWEDTNYWN